MELVDTSRYYLVACAHHLDGIHTWDAPVACTLYLAASETVPSFPTTHRPPFAKKSCQDSIAQIMHRTGSAKSQMPALTICQDWHGLITVLTNIQDYPAIPCWMSDQDKLPVRVDSADWPDCFYCWPCLRGSPPHCAESWILARLRHASTMQL